MQFGYLETNTKVLKKDSSKVFRFLKMTVLLKDPKGVLWYNMTSKKKFMWSYQEFRGLQMAIKRKALHQLKQLGIQPN